MAPASAADVGRNAADMVFLHESLTAVPLAISIARSASRLVRTGQADTGNISAAQFKTALCAEMSVFEGDCASRADVDVRVMPQFTDGIPASPIRNGVMNTADLQYNKGQPGDLMLVRVWYSQPLVTPFMQQAMSRLNSGAAVISVATAFRNEPYGGSTP